MNSRPPPPLPLPCLPHLKPRLPLARLHLALLDLDHMCRRRALADILQQLLHRILGALGFALDL